MNGIIKNMRGISIIRSILGLLMIILGIYALVNPSTVLTSLAVAFACYAMISGIIDIVIYFSFEDRYGIAPTFSLVGGITSTIAGLLMFTNLGTTSTILTLLFPLWFMSSCFTRLAQLPFIRIYSGSLAYWLSFLISIFGIYVSITLMFNLSASATTTILFVSLYLLANGITHLVEGLMSYITLRKV